MAKSSKPDPKLGSAGKQTRKARTTAMVSLSRPVTHRPQRVSFPKEPRRLKRRKGFASVDWRGPLVLAAADARQGAVAPYSKFKVGAALLTRAGNIITGANVESASYGLTCCAERVALFHALTSGEADFVALAVVARTQGGAMPCGACRQLLAEYAPNATVWVADSAALAVIQEFSYKNCCLALLSGSRFKDGLETGSTVVGVKA